MAKPFRLPDYISLFRSPQLQLCLALETGESVTVQMWDKEADDAEKRVIFGRLRVADQIVLDVRMEPALASNQAQVNYPGLFLDLLLKHFVQKADAGEEMGMTSHQLSLLALAAPCLRNHSYQFSSDDGRTPVVRIVDTEDDDPKVHTHTINKTDSQSLGGVREFIESIFSGAPSFFSPSNPASSSTPTVPTRYLENPEVFLRSRRESTEIRAAAEKLSLFDKKFFLAHLDRIWNCPDDACVWKGCAKPFVYFDLVDVFDSSSLQRYAERWFDDVDELEFDDRVLFVLNELLQGGVAFAVGLLSLDQMPIEGPEEFYKVSCVWDMVVRRQSKLLNAETAVFFQVATRPDAVKKCIPTNWERCFTLLAYPLPWCRLDLGAVRRDYRSVAGEILSSFRETPFVSADVLRQ